MNRKTTLTDIAQAAGVSLSTVDRVLNHRGGVSPVKEAQVLEWASRLNLDRVMFRSYLKVLRVAVMMQSPQNPFYRGLRDAFTEINAAMLDMKINCFLHYIDVIDTAATTRKINQISETYDALIVICYPMRSGSFQKEFRSLPWSPICRTAVGSPMSGRTTVRSAAWQEN
jgi:LacI family transcriptional regulator